MPPDGRPVVAVIGRPNVGKSSLVNRVVGKRTAIVAGTPGVTRDRRSFTATWANREFEIVDTGGLEQGADGLEARVAEQAQVALAAADMILFVVDGSVGAVAGDLEVAEMLRVTAKPVIVVVNKVDRPHDDVAVADFYSLGLGEPVPVSALHGHGSGDLLDVIVRALPPDATGETKTSWASIALVGRPNVGKSSLFNRVLRGERSLVDATAGTTRDPVDTVIDLDDSRKVTIVDTAGMRPEVRIKDEVEYFSWLRARGTLHEVDAALLVVDSAEGVTGTDQRLAAAIEEAGRACVVALNKWDLVTSVDADRARFEAGLAEGLRFLPWATLRRTSAVSGRGVDKLLDDLTQAIDSHRTRIPTGELNRAVTDAVMERPHPRVGGRSARVLYAVQPKVGPPTVVLFCNRRLQTSYLRYLESALRRAYPLPGSPLRLQVRVKSRSRP